MEFDKDLKSIQEARNLIEKARDAQEVIRHFSQKQLDKIVEKMAIAAEAEAERLAKLAHEETTFGKWQDKVIKNIFASKGVLEHIKDIKAVGVLSEDVQNKVVNIGVPVGVITGLIPSTNPTSTTIYKALIAIKSGNAIIFSPHPSAKKCILETVKVLTDAAAKAGAPEGIISCLTTMTLQATTELMQHKDVSLILATGGETMVKAAYKSGTPAIGVGPGNSPVFIEKSADIKEAVKNIIASKTFDNGVICASEQAIVVEEVSKDEVVKELKLQGAYFLTEEESNKLGSFLLKNGVINPQFVGKDVNKISELTGMQFPKNTKVLISKQTTVNKKNPYSREKLAPILGFYVEKNIEAVCHRCIELLLNEGKGHTFAMHSNDEAKVKRFALKMPVSRMVVNTPSALGGVGATTNIAPSFTLGCGAIGGSSTSDNVDPLNLINVRKMAYGTKSVEHIKPQPQTQSSRNVSEEEVEELIRAVLHLVKN